MTARPEAPAGVTGSLLRRFATSFLLLVLLLAAVVRFDASLQRGAGASWVTHHAAALVATTVAAGGASVERSDNRLRIGNAEFVVIPECTGVEIIGSFVAAVLAFPTTWSRRLTAVVRGVAVLAVLNLVRMVSLVWIGTRSPVLLEYGHLYVWSLILLWAALLMWAQWAQAGAADHVGS